MNFNRRHHVGFDASTDMGFHPLLFSGEAVVLDVVPMHEPAEGKAGGIHRKVGFDRRQRQAGLPDQPDKDWEQPCIIRAFRTLLKCGKRLM